MKFFVINGPNLNMLGIREPAIYGSTTYADLVRLVEQAAKELQVEVEILQSNHEGTLVDEIQRAYYEADGIVINPAAYTHTSVAVLDALKAVALPAVEIYLQCKRKGKTFGKFLMQVRLAFIPLWEKVLKDTALPCGY